MKWVEKLCMIFLYQCTSCQFSEISIVLHKVYKHWKGICHSGRRASDSRVSHQRQRTTWAGSALVCCFLERAFRSQVSFLIHPSEWDSYSWPFHCRILEKLYVVGRQERKAFRVRLILNIVKKTQNQKQNPKKHENQNNKPPRRWEMQFAEHQPMLFSNNYVLHHTFAFCPSYCFLDATIFSPQQNDALQWSTFVSQ